MLTTTWLEEAAQRAESHLNSIPPVLRGPAAQRLTTINLFDPTKFEKRCGRAWKGHICTQWKDHLSPHHCFCDYEYILRHPFVVINQEAEATARIYCSYSGLKYQVGGCWCGRGEFSRIHSKG